MYYSGRNEEEKKVVVSWRPAFWLKFDTLYKRKLLSATQPRAIQRLGSFRQLVGIILRTSDTGWNFYVEEGFRFQVKPRYCARRREKTSVLWQSQEPRERTYSGKGTNFYRNQWCQFHSRLWHDNLCLLLNFFNLPSFLAFILCIYLFFSFFLSWLPSWS